MKAIFGSRKGKRSCGAAGKVVVFGILNRTCWTYTNVVNDTKTETSMPLIVTKIAPDNPVTSLNCGHATILYQSLPLK